MSADDTAPTSTIGSIDGPADGPSTSADPGRVCWPEIEICPVRSTLPLEPGRLPRVGVSTTAPAGLPVTGSGSDGFAGAGLVLVGSLLLVAVRRKGARS